MRTAHRSVLLPLSLIIGFAPGARAFAPPAPGALSALERSTARIVPAAYDESVQRRLRDGNPDVRALVVEAGGAWQVDFDAASGRLRRAFGTGISLMSEAAAAKPTQAELELA